MNSKFKAKFVDQFILHHNQLYIMPNQFLSRYIVKYTICFENNNRNISDTLTLIPDASGCLVFTYDGCSFNSVLWGGTTENFVVKNDLNFYPMQLFIELQPGALFNLTDVKQIELTNRQMPLSQINTKLHLLIVEAFENARSLRHFINKLNTILTSYFQNDNMPQVCFSALDKIISHKGCLSIKELSDLECYSTRHLNRIFNDYIGINIKTFSNIIRINYILQKMNKEKYIPRDLAQSSGFYDQAHFIHAFKAVCGTTPMDYFKNMSQFYNDSFKL